MNRRHLTAVSLLTSALLWFFSATAFAQDTRNCADFSTQEEAQAFYDQHEDDDPNDPDPNDLDTDGDGQACEGLPTSGQAASPAPNATAAPQSTASPSSDDLPASGAATAVMALSGLTLLEAGYGLTLASKRLGVRRRSDPLYLMRKLVAAASHGEARVKVSDDLYLVHRSFLEDADVRLAPVPEPVSSESVVEEPIVEPTYYETPDIADMPPVLEGDEFFVTGEAEVPATTSAPRPNVYAALAKLDGLHLD